MESYDKLREIGKGSYGVVWLVKNKKDRKNYVLKRIDLRKSSERDKLSAQQEAQLLKNLKHPNIVAYKESFQVDGYLHIVMLYCDGGDLYTKIKEQNGRYLEETQIVEWFVQIAMAIQYMHERYILHRDLKTQNIFLTKNKIIKVGDLGIARVLKSNQDMATTIIGTPYYMSPELFSNKPYNSKSDVWALGCCVYEMTTLKHAFNAKDMSSLVFKITKGKMPDIPSHYSKELIVLIKSMLNADPKQRPTATKILRDPFIKKNIMHFLERTKQKQQQQLERENNMRNDFETNQRFSIQNQEKQSNLTQKIQVQESEKSSKSEFVNLNNLEEYNSQKQVPQVQPRSSWADSEQKQVKLSSIYDQEDSKSKQVEEKKVKKSASRVRISSVVENIETKEHFSLIDSSSLSDKEALSDEEHEPYQLTKPMKLLNHEQEAKIRNRPLSGDKNNDFNQNHQQPKIIERKPVIVDNPPKIQQRVSSTPNFPSNSSDLNNNSHIENQAVQPNLSARERRRLKLRLSQNESNSDTKPPLLKKLPLKSNQSEVFYNSNNKNNSSSNSSSNAPVSKSLNENEHNKQILQDSLKIFRKNSNQPGNESPSNSSGLIQQQNKLERDPYFPKKQSPLINKSTESPASSSSSSSSIASSNEDNDPGKELIRIEKRKKKDKKEMDNFIDQLSTTLKAVTKLESEAEDLKDEILDDLEEEALQVEMNDRDLDYNSQNFKRNNDLSKAVGDKIKKVEFFAEKLNDEENDKFDLNIVKHRNEKLKQNEYEKSNFEGATLGATNHMYSRINSLEKECLEVIGREKLNQVFKIMDSFKDDEVESRLVALIGRQLFKDYNGKLWLLKFCKDTAKIGMK